MMHDCTPYISRDLASSVLQSVNSILAECQKGEFGKLAAYQIPEGPVVGSRRRAAKENPLKKMRDRLEKTGGTPGDFGHLMLRS